MSARDDVLDLLENVPDERLEDVRVYLERLRQADAAWQAWDQHHGGPEAVERLQRAVAEADAEDRPSVPHDVVVNWLRSWGTDDELPSPLDT